MIEFNIPLFQVFTLLAAVVFPLLVGLVTNRETNPGRKAVLLAGLAVLISLCTELAAALQTGATYNLGMALLTGLGSFLVAVAMHYGLWKPTGVAEKLQGIGSGDAVEPKHSFVEDDSVQHVTIADIDASKLGRSSGPHVRVEADEPGKHVTE